MVFVHSILPAPTQITLEEANLERSYSQVILIVEAIGVCRYLCCVDCPSVTCEEQSTTVWAEAWLGTTITRGKLD